MAQKYVGLDDAAEQLGISKDRLNDLREAGKVRAYRDGASWKFRAEDVDKLATEGIPALDAGGSDLSLDSGLSLGSDLSLDSDSAADSQQRSSAASSDLDLDLGDENLPGIAAASDVDLDDLDEPTVPIEGSAEEVQAIELAASDDDDASDSILLSESELGESTDRPPSTIIGKAEMAADMDLKLAPSDSDEVAASDVKLAPTASDVFSSGSPDDAVLDSEPPSLSDNFVGLEELEIDLEAESSRILSPEDVAEAKEAAATELPATGNLDLAPSDSSSGPAASGGALDGDVGGSGGGLTGLSALELDGDDDDDVLGDESDITLSGDSSGINIISPSDSGLALDDVALDLSGSSPIGSSIDLGSIAPDEAELEPSDAADSEGDEPFTLTPFAEEATEEDDDSSQIIPLDEVSEEEDAGALLGMGEAESLGVGLGAAALGAGTMATVEPTTDTPFSVGNIVGLSLCLLLLAFCGMMTFDLVRNIWSWDQTFTINSTLLEVVNPFMS